jgi:hypothetical protein
VYELKLTVMKTLNPSLFLLVFSSLNISIAQDSINTDSDLSAQLVGTWEHVSSTYPSGDVSTYQRKFQFYADGTGVCARYTDLDTVLIHFEWTVKDSVISLFEIRKNGKSIYADSQIITFVDLHKMHLSDAYCDDQTGKICCYRRSSDLEIAKF